MIFTKQMAALYNPSAYNGTDIILDIDYTDISKCYRIILGKTKSTVLEKFDGKPTTIIHTPFSVWQSIAAGEIEGSEALMKHLYSVEGDFDLMIKWDEYFGNNQNVSTKRNHKSSKKKNRYEIHSNFMDSFLDSCKYQYILGQYYQHICLWTFADYVL